MDADFQDPPEVVPQLIDAWRGGAEVVVAVRRSRQERRKILALLFPLFYRVLGAISDYPLSLNAGLFGLMDRKAVDSILAMGEKNPYLPGLRAWVGYRNTIVYYDRQDRLCGDGKLSFMSRIKYATDAIMSFSYKPIRLSFVLCCLATCVAFLLGLGALISSSPIRAAALGVECAVFLMGGLLLLTVGVLGEYIIRVFDQVRARPLSLISQVHRAPAEVAAQSGAISIQNGSYAVQPEAYTGKRKARCIESVLKFAACSTGGQFFPLREAKNHSATSEASLIPASDWRFRLGAEPITGLSRKSWGWNSLRYSSWPAHCRWEVLARLADPSS